MQKSIFGKYFSLCAALVIVSVTVLGAVFMVFASQYFKNDKYLLLRNNLDRAVQMTEQYYSNDTAVNQPYYVDGMKVLATTIDANIFIVDLEGRTLHCTETPPCRHLDSRIPATVIETLLQDGEYTEMGRLGNIYEERFYTVGVPVRINGELRGCLFASANASMQQQDFLNEMLKMFLISAAVVLVLTVVATYFISMQMVKPLRQMAAAAQRFGRGEFEGRLEVSGYDEIGQLQMALNNMAQSLSTLEVTHRSFTANISHELKTPMTTISGFIDGILDGTIPPEQQRYYLQIVSDETKRLARLVRTMLNLSRIEAGEMKINPASFNMVETICQVLFSFEHQIDKKNLTIRGLDHDKVMVEADPDLIHQVVYNLTENAVKFVNEGGYLEFGFSRDANRTYVSLKNSGEGLSKEELPKIFDRFYKTDKSRGRDKNGVGLGLYIVRSIVNLHGGDVIVRSVQGEYAEFVFSIPHSRSAGESSGKFKKNS